MPNADCAVCQLPFDAADLFEVVCRVRRSDTGDVLAETPTILVCDRCVAALVHEHTLAGATVTAEYELEVDPHA